MNCLIDFLFLSLADEICHEYIGTHGKTDEEISLVCETSRVPMRTTERDDGWKAFRIQGVLDFSLIGILSKITTLLAENGVGIFAVSTYNTDYILVKAAQFEKALAVLAHAGYEIAR